jgi:hypothetical protein
MAALVEKSVTHSSQIGTSSESVSGDFIVQKPRIFARLLLVGPRGLEPKTFYFSDAAPYPANAKTFPRRAVQFGI